MSTASRIDEIVQRLQPLARPDALEFLARFGIPAQAAWGVPAVELRRLGRELKREPGAHDLAEALWQMPNIDLRALATLIDDPALVDEGQMERWAASFDSWGTCDAACALFRYSPLAPRKAAEWSGREEEYVRRAGFSLMAGLAVVAKDAPDAMFEQFLELILRRADDPRNFVKKAVSWALREIGKRRPALHVRAVEVATALGASSNRAERWVGKDALRELTSVRVLAKVGSADRAPAAASAGSAPQTVGRTTKKSTAR